ATTIETRQVDADQLFRICAGRVGCSVARRLLNHALNEIKGPLSRRLKAQYSLHIFRARARLDLPTYEDPLVQRQLDEASSTSGSIAYDSVMMAGNIVSVVAQVLGGQRDGLLLAILCFATSMSDWMKRWNVFGLEQVWAATTKDKDYIRMVGMKFVVNNMEHRKEFVAGNLSEFMTKEFEEVSQRVGPDNMMDFTDVRRTNRTRQRLSFWSLVQDPLRELLRSAVPASMPVSLASLNLLQQSTSQFSFMASSITEQLATVRKLYEVANIPNRIEDGTVPFPEDAQDQERHCVGVQVRKLMHVYPLELTVYRNVSFRYPGSEQCAPEHFVIVGANGSGKNLLDGHDIRTLKLFDLRQAISVLFQDYTHFPLSIRDNIALGDPGPCGLLLRDPRGDEDALRAEHRLLGGARRREGGWARTGGTTLSGGQMQRLAVSRTFMRSVVSEDAKVGLLLFDEPSASLDPTAEHDLFARLRELRGNKTMVFSSHRFGNLTRHADLILCVSAGTHDELIKRIWMLQAQAFL
ncbi:P-loop containing nucleoside triphosphate hydrolase protein, partial [Cerioporus squamosus]